jgi:hypothetical protein
LKKTNSVCWHTILLSAFPQKLRSNTITSALANSDYRSPFSPCRRHITFFFFLPAQPNRRTPERFTERFNVSLRRHLVLVASTTATHTSRSFRFARPHAPSFPDLFFVLFLDFFASLSIPPHPTLKTRVDRMLGEKEVQVEKVQQSRVSSSPGSS